jgi:osmotically-inducible protein OsmY
MFYRLISLALLCMLLSGCVDAALTGAQVIYDRHDIQNSVSDRYISFQIQGNIYATPAVYDHSNISIMTFHQIVLLTGQVPTVAIKQRATQLAKVVKGVKKVYNLLTIGSNISSARYISDSWVTTKIHAQMLANAAIDPDDVKFTTEDGVVYLMGFLTPEQARLLVNLTRTTNGVRQVITVFKYIHYLPHHYVNFDDQRKSM